VTEQPWTGTQTVKLLFALLSGERPISRVRFALKPAIPLEITSADCAFELQKVTKRALRNILVCCGNAHSAGDCAAGIEDLKARGPRRIHTKP
jgi:hypothetical protein